MIPMRKKIIPGNDQKYAFIVTKCSARIYFVILVYFLENNSKH